MSDEDFILIISSKQELNIFFIYNIYMYIEVENYFKSYSFAWLGIYSMFGKNDFKINMRKNRFDESDIQNHNVNS